MRCIKKSQLSLENLARSDREKTEWENPFKRDKDKKKSRDKDLNPSVHEMANSAYSNPNQFEDTRMHMGRSTHCSQVEEPQILQDTPPTVPFEVGSDDLVHHVLDKMSHTGFQGRNLAKTFEIWSKMIRDPECTIWLGLAGALVPAGMREIFAYLIRNRMVDVIVATGSTLTHDIHETLGGKHYEGDREADDEELKDQGVDRIYDVYLQETALRVTEDNIRSIAQEFIPQGQPVKTRYFFNQFGKAMHGRAVKHGILTLAYEYGVPVYCPALGDSVIGLALALANYRDGANYQFDILGDVIETCLITTQVAQKTGVIYMGGGTPKNFIQQTAYGMSAEYEKAHTYALQFTADDPKWGGLSGCTFNEAKSWGKIDPSADQEICFVDATIGLPVVVSALASSGVKRAVVPDIVGALDGGRQDREEELAAHRKDFYRKMKEMTGQIPKTSGFSEYEQPRQVKPVDYKPVTEPQNTKEYGSGAGPDGEHFEDKGMTSFAMADIVKEESAGQIDQVIDPNEQTTIPRVERDMSIPRR